MSVKKCKVGVGCNYLKKDNCVSPSYVRKVNTRGNSIQDTSFSCVF